MAIKAGIENWPAASLALPAMSASWLSFVPLGLLTVAAVRSIAVTTKHPQPEGDGAYILPAALSKQYQDLLLSGATEIQVKDLLRPYNGRWMELEVEVASVTHDSGKIRIQSYISDGENRECIWVYFSKKWEDHLKFVKRYSTLRFRGRINIPNSGHPRAFSTAAESRGIPAALKF